MQEWLTLDQKLHQYCTSLEDCTNLINTASGQARWAETRGKLWLAAMDQYTENEQDLFARHGWTEKDFMDERMARPCDPSPWIEGFLNLAPKINP